ncbi:MAG: ABC transporter substrate-binding protein [Elusimicrobiota bacterium]
MVRKHWLIPAVISIFLIACSKTDDQGRKIIKSKDKSTYVHATISDIDSLDPAWSYDTASHAIIANIYEFLFNYKGESISELEPVISEKIPSRENGLISEDGQTYTFPIRKGVKFHLGGEVTPDDVRYSLMRFMLYDRAGGPSELLLQPLTGLASTRDSKGAIIRDAYDKVADAVQVRGQDVVIRLHKPFSPILMVLAGWAPIVDKEWVVEHGGWDGRKVTWEKFNDPNKIDSYLYDHENGTGPFMLERWDKRGKEIMLTRFDEYWLGKAKLKTAKFKGIDEFQTRKLMLAAGDADSIVADYIHQPLLRNIDGVEIIDDLPRIDMSPAMFFVFKINTQGNPYVGSGKLDGRGIPADFFNDKNLRLGVAHSFDYEGFIRDVNRGKGERATSFIPKGLLGHNPDQPVYPYDLEKAEEYFKKAWGGEVWKNGFKFTLAYNQGNQSRQVMATMLKRAVETLNPKFKIDTQVLQWSTYLDSKNKSKLPMFILGWAPDYPDPHNFAFPYMHSQGNYPRLQGYKNPKADELVTAAMTEIDPAKREAMYHELQKIAHEDITTIFVLTTVRFRTQRTWVKGFTYNPIYPDSPYNCPLYYLSKN